MTLVNILQKNSSWKNHKKSPTENPEFILQVSEINEPLISFLIDKSQSNITESKNIITLPLILLHNTKVSTGNSSLDNNNIMSSFMTQHYDPTPQSFIKTTFHP